MNKTTLSYSSQRNPVISLIKDDLVFHKIQTIGDPHLGRVFKTGVPSHRSGEREVSLLNTFNALLNPKDPLVKDVIVPGDLFDKFIVSPTVVLEAFNIVVSAIENNPSVRYTFLPGNHDLSKDVSKKSSYEVFYNLMLPYTATDQVKVLLLGSAYSLIYNEDLSVNTVLFFDCYTPFQDKRVPFTEEVADVWSESEHIISFGHWDSLSILESGYTPDQELLDASSLVVSGHEHTYRMYRYPYDKGSCSVLFTGSMQPYSHAEDPNSTLYITIPQEDVEQYYGTDLLKYKCVRIYCDNTFALSENLDCLSLSYLYKEALVEDVEEELDISTDVSYSTQMLTVIQNIQSETGYEKTLLSSFKEGSDASN